jgi:hypothetical protein
MRRAVTIIATAAIPVAVVLALAFGLAACGDDSPTGPTPTETVTVTATPTPSDVPTDDPSAIMTVSLYFLRGEELGVAHRAVPASGTPATAAVEALLAGPDKREKAAGLGTAVPADTRLNGIDIDDRVARVDLSGTFQSGGGSAAMQARVAQVVYTLTQFATVDEVVFMIDGEVVDTIGGEGVVVDGPQSRDDWAGLLPAIFVETPAVGDVITASPLRVRGNASVFEATFVAQVVNATGQIVVDQTVTASEGAPGRGDFSVRLKLPPATGKGKLVVFEVSMEDGSRMNEVRIPLRFDVAE